MGQVKKPPIGNHLAAECDDKHLAAEGVNVRRDRLKPVNEAILRRQPMARCGPRLGRVFRGNSLFIFGGNGEPLGQIRAFDGMREHAAGKVIRQRMLTILEITPQGLHRGERRQRRGFGAQHARTQLQ